VPPLGKPKIFLEIVCELASITISGKSEAVGGKTTVLSECNETAADSL